VNSRLAPAALRFAPVAPSQNAFYGKRTKAQGMPEAGG